ncbi:uncharacterized protein LOC124295332 [Neodiprion lecontei]|uniref:Uncharacterized protein LOC124295332 n=1 Tax=Neodiprion lecontei TaxID=441921 RepID=A0ABM3GKV6_NEOLC|nr:uncharacterized protein LOC124295332 [Neodiprion lecontei]XP_046600904.1 uncharacterized protein LOC124295332 [Neodiprion lecontei]
MPKRNRGQDLYAAREKEIGAAYREQKNKLTSLAYVEFKRQYWKKFKSAAAHEPQPGPSSRPDPAPGPADPDTPGDTYPDLSPGTWDDLLEFLVPKGVPFSNMEVDEQNVQQEGSVPGVPARGGSGGGPAIVSLPRSMDADGWKMSFHKSRVMFSYAYANVNLSTAFTNSDVMTTPLTYIPVDFLPFYLSPSEYDNMPPFAKVTNVWCRVRIIGVRSGFDTGATNSSTATAEYCPILMTAVGLNNKIDNLNMSYNTVATSPMVPTGTGALDSDLIHRKYYDSVASSVQCVPRSSSYYACQYWNKESHEPTDAGNKLQPHTGKMFRLDKVVDLHLLNSAIGEQVIEYSYKPRSGFINRPKTSFVPWQRMGEQSRNQFGGFKHLTQWNKQLGQLEMVHNDTTAACFNVATNRPLYSYNQNIETYGTFSTRDDWITEGLPQPQVHIGMQAILQLNPSTESTTFLNAAVYYHIDCGCDIVGDNSSIWTNGRAATHHINERWFTHGTQHYQQPVVNSASFKYSTDGIKSLINNRIESDASGSFARLIRDKGVFERLKEMSVAHE